MNEDELKSIEDWYHKYVRNYEVDGRLPPMQAVKHEHSLSVAAEAENLSADLDWTTGDVRNARLAGLLHDVGRFSQFAEFKTFRDAASIDHAERGAQILILENVLGVLNDRDRRLILEGVRYHNRKIIPETLTGISKLFLKLLRDADKLDIFRVLINAHASGKIQQYPEFLLGTKMQGKANLGQVENVCCGKMMDTPAIDCLADLFLLQVSWVYDINFIGAMRQIRDRRYLENIAEALPEDEGLQRALRAAVLFRDSFIDKGSSQKVCGQ